MKIATYFYIRTKTDTLSSSMFLVFVNLCAAPVIKNRLQRDDELQGMDLQHNHNCTDSGLASWQVQDVKGGEWEGCRRPGRQTVRGSKIGAKMNIIIEINSDILHSTNLKLLS
jgi:hypothetical protein